MGNKRITEKDFWRCSEGNIPTQFQGSYKGQKKAGGEVYIVKADTATVGCLDFGCKKYTMLIALAAAVAVVALAVIGVITVATGGAALIALGALAGTVGAIVGSVVGGLLCGQKMSSKRKWIEAPKQHKTIFQGHPQVTGDWTMTCPIGGVITFDPRIKSWSQALSLATAGYITDILDGMTKGALVGMGGAAISGIGSVGALFSGSGSAIMGNLGRATLQGLGRIGTNLAEGLLLDFGSKSAEATANVLQNYGETGNLNVVDDFASGYVESSLEDLNALNNIRKNGGAYSDWEAAVMLLAPGGGGNRDNTNNNAHNNSNNIDGDNSNGDSHNSNNSENTESNTDEHTVKPVDTNKDPNTPTIEKGEAFEDGSQTNNKSEPGDPPGTWRDKNGRLHDEKTGRFVVDPKVGKRKAIDFYKKHNPDMAMLDIESHIAGIDFTKKVEIIPITEGTSLTQYTKVNTEGTVLRGDYYTDNPNNTPSELGVSDKYNVRDPNNGWQQTDEIKTVTKENVIIPKDSEGLKSTSAEIDDTWSLKDQSVHTEGGGSQIYIPKTQFKL